jgi:anti-sigma factor RsiW
MNCNECRPLTQAYVDNELDTPTAIRVASHMEECPTCRSACENTRLLHGALEKHATHYQAPAHLRHRVQLMIDAEKASSRKASRLSRSWIGWGLSTGFSAAFAIMLALYLQVPSASEQFEQELVADHYRSLMADHLTDVASSDKHTVKPWFTGKLDFSPPVHDLAQQDFPLVGGRLEYLDKRPAAALAYRHGRHLINLFVLPNEGRGKDTSSEIHTRQGFQLIHWTQSGMAYWAVSDMSAEEMLRFQRLLSSRIAEGEPAVSQ